MTANQSTDTEGLRALLAKATPGPWETDDDLRNDGVYGDGGPDGRSGFKSSAIRSGPLGLALMDSLNSETILVHEDADDEGDRIAWDEIARNNAALIVAAVNALPALLAELDEARKDAARYQWLHKQRDVLLLTSFFGNACMNRTGDDLNAAIDAAMSAAEKEKGR